VPNGVTTVFLTVSIIEITQEMFLGAEKISNFKITSKLKPYPTINPYLIKSVA